MSILSRIHALIAESHATGYASELPDSVQRLFHELAGEVEKLGAAAAGPSLASIEQLRTGLEQDLGDKLGKVLEAFVGNQVAAVDAVRAEVEELRARLNAKDTPAEAPPPQADPQPAGAAPAAPEAPNPQPQTASAAAPETQAAESPHTA